MSNFSERLRYRRNNLGMTQEDLAARSGFSVSSITAWERGVNPPTMVMVQAEGMDSSVYRVR